MQLGISPPDLWQEGIPEFRMRTAQEVRRHFADPISVLPYGLGEHPLLFTMSAPSGPPFLVVMPPPLQLLFVAMSCATVATTSRNPTRTVAGFILVILQAKSVRRQSKYR